MRLYPHYPSTWTEHEKKLAELYTAGNDLTDEEWRILCLAQSEKGKPVYRDVKPDEPSAELQHGDDYADLQRHKG